ncbi:MAG: hypothetical protein WA937_13330 [Flavobacteriales bacterium]
MNLLRTTAAAGLAGLSILLSAQTPQPAQWSREIPDFNKNAYQSQLACADGTVYGSRWFSQPISAQLIKLAPDGKTGSKELVLPHKKKHNAFNAFVMIGGKPCIVYDDWDKKTGVLQLSLQAYSPALDPEGPPVALGSIPLNPKSYYGSSILLSTKHSADRTKTLIYYDDIQQGSVKLGMYWVVDENRELLWSGAYRIPVVALGSSTSTWLANDGHVHVRVKAVGLEDVKTKEKKDGTEALRTQAMPWRNMRTSWYEMFGETFNKWEPDTEDGEVGWNLSFANHGNTNMLAGLRTTGSGKDITAEWVVLRLDDGLSPVMVGRGPAKAVSGEGALESAVVDEAGNVYVSMLFKESTYLARIDQGSSLAWEHMLAWNNPSFFLYKGQASSMSGIAKGKVDKVLAGEAFQTVQMTNTTEVPMAIAVGPDGKDRRMVLLPEEEIRGFMSWEFNPESIIDCDCYTNLTPKTKGFVSIKLAE